MFSITIAFTLILHGNFSWRVTGGFTNLSAIKPAQKLDVISSHSVYQQINYKQSLASAYVNPLESLQLKSHTKGSFNQEISRISMTICCSNNFTKILTKLAQKSFLASLWSEQFGNDISGESQFMENTHYGNDFCHFLLNESLGIYIWQGHLILKLTKLHLISVSLPFILSLSLPFSWWVTNFTVQSLTMNKYKQGVIEEGGCTLIPFVYNTMAHNYCYHRLAYGN